ncbi:hypothetical protein C0971_10090 [Bacillus methanolicus]|uniref:hypothetical protein n=1 Tax=Bacillus methanolicus TaxID=1471 RepID=UPI00200F2C56|nr:hypothetical protein [Bacillus methanolicus]UQD52322.1 hypothetical protein C0971_10090 [Bacillus methanolicus]
MSETINSISTFWDAFKLPVSMSLIGAIIGHYRKNGVIQWPIFSISYEPGPYFTNLKGWAYPLRVLYLFIDFILYVIGIHIGKKREPVSFDLGFFGDLLIGIGAGILAKVVIELGDIKNEFALISSSLLAGFAGMSYMLKFQKEAESNWEEDKEAVLKTAEIAHEDPLSKDESSFEPNLSENPQQQTIKETASTQSDI